MIISINSKRTPPPHRGTFNHRLRHTGALLAVFATSLMLISCPSPGGGDTNPSGGGTTAPDGGKPTPPAPDPGKPTPEPPTPPPKPKAWHVTTLIDGTAAGFNILYGIVQSGDTLYVTDRTNHSIRTVHTTTARVGTIVPSRPGLGAHADGPGTSARFNDPRGAAAAGSTLYVADNFNNRIRAIDLASTNKTVSTIAGSGTPGHADGAGTAAQFRNPTGLALSGTMLYVADAINHRIRAIDLASTNKAVGTIAGSGTPGHADGAGTAAQFDNPTGLALSGTTLYVADASNNRIRAIDLANKAVSTIAGSGTPGHANGVGAAAQFNFPTGIAVSGDTLYVADQNNHRIRAIDLASGTVRDIAGDGTTGNTNGIGTAARLTRPNGIFVSGDTLYVTSRRLIRKLEYREAGS